MSLEIDDLDIIICQENAKKERDEMFQFETFYYEELETIIRQENAKKERDALLKKK